MDATTKSWLSRMDAEPCAAGLAFVALAGGTFEALREALKTPVGCSYIRWYALHAEIECLSGWTWPRWFDAVHAHFHSEVPYLAPGAKVSTWEDDRRYALTWPAAIKIYDTLYDAGQASPPDVLGDADHWPNWRPELPTLTRKLREAAEKRK